ncbi:MAG: AMIN domain-containing protein [Limnothrix sp. RL_2_0]|nr:AMIN domain-containing protein [Limnothrix sp. RL_2_0]
MQVHALASPSYFVLQEPTRIVVDVADTSWGNGSIAKSYTGAVSQIRVAQFSEGITRFVLDWSGNLPAKNSLQLRSFPQANDSVLWQLNLGNSIATTASNTTVFNGNMQFPPALLPPPFQGSVTIAPPPIPNNLRK